MLFRGILKNYTADLILWTEFKRTCLLKKVAATHKSSQVVPRCSVEKMFLVACRAVKLMYSFINISCQISVAS